MLCQNVQYITEMRVFRLGQISAAKPEMHAERVDFAEMSIHDRNEKRVFRLCQNVQHMTE